MTNKESIIKAVEGILAGDGNLYDRMNAGQGGIGLSEWVFTIVDYCKSEGITEYTIAKESEKGKLAEMIELGASLM